MRLEGIDLLRGIAVSFVIIYHFFTVLGLYNNPIFPYIHSFGLFGVSLFFIISGYLIYRSIDHSISRKGTKPGVKHYISHRLFRILPAYYFNLAIVLIMASFVIGNHYFYSEKFLYQVLSHLAFLSHFIYKDTGFGINGVYWTLSIEMLWYILAPILYIYIRKDRYLLILFILSFIYLLGLDFAMYDSLFNLDKHASNYTILQYYWSFQLPGQLIYFIAGVFIYKYIKQPLSISTSFQYILSILIVTLFIYISKRYHLYEHFMINNLFILILVASLFILLYKTKPKWMTSVEWLGEISYSLYLWHVPLLYIMKKTNILTHISLISAIIIFITFLLFISSLSYYFIEKGGFNLRKKFEDKIKKSTIHET